MGRRHTVKENRRLPISGRVRWAARLSYVENAIDEKTGEPLFNEILDYDDEGNETVLQARPNRANRRRIAKTTRLRNNGQFSVTPPIKGGEPVRLKEQRLELERKIKDKVAAGDGDTVSDEEWEEFLRNTERRLAKQQGLEE